MPQSGTGPTSHTYFSQRLRLHYVDWGNHGAPPLLLVHGSRDHCRSWDWIAERLRNDWHIVAPDLRGHGDSDWTSDGTYSVTSCIYDLAQLIDQQSLAPVTIIGHSYGGNVCLRYTGIYPQNVRKIVAVEGLGYSPKILAERAANPAAERLQTWIKERHGLSGRLAHRYPSIEEAVRRMQEANLRLTGEQAQHLTQYGINQNEDGTYSWKFDPYMRLNSPMDLIPADVQSLWSRITCPTLLVCGNESHATNPLTDGRAQHFANAEVVAFDGAGHWVHHDRLEDFVALLRRFL